MSPDAMLLAYEAAWTDDWDSWCSCQTNKQIIASAKAERLWLTALGFLFAEASQQCVKQRGSHEQRGVPQQQTGASPDKGRPSSRTDGSQPCGLSHLDDRANYTHNIHFYTHNIHCMATAS